MKSIEASGKTVDCAIDKALNKLKKSKDEVEIEVLEEPSKGIFGILGSRLARIRVTIKESPSDIARDFLNEVLSQMKVDVKFETKNTGEYYYLSMSGENLGILIGHRGETLDALQYLTNLAVSRKLAKKVRIVLDVEGYRKKRENTLVNLALRLSERVKKDGKKITLEPMSPYERRIIHTTLQEEKSIYTFSEGEEPYRKVVIAPKNR